MIANNWKFILIFFSLLLLNTKNIQAQQQNCNWVVEFANQNFVELGISDLTGNYVLFFCENKQMAKQFIFT